MAQAKEAVANRFASDLLLPPYLLKPIVCGLKSIETKTVEQVANTFRASLTATAIKLVQLVSIPSMVVCHTRLGKKWHFPGPLSAQDMVAEAGNRPGQARASVCCSRIARTRRLQSGLVRTLGSTEGTPERFDVWEQSFKTVEGEVLTILTFKDPKMFDDTVGSARWA